MAVLTPEQQKQMYSRQLAEYTLRQWNEVCKMRDAADQKSGSTGRATSRQTVQGRDSDQTVVAEKSPSRTSGTSAPPHWCCAAEETLTDALPNTNLKMEFTGRGIRDRVAKVWGGWAHAK
jgi:hypothetical protein